MNPQATGDSSDLCYNTVGLTIEQPLRVNFVPTPDITAYELATAMPFFFGQPMYQASFDALGDAQRHWRRY
jgi:hypothetical protein